MNRSILIRARSVCSVSQGSLWRRERLGSEVSVCLVLLASLYSWSYESSCKSCSAMEQVFCYFLLTGDLLGPVIFLRACCPLCMAFFLFFIFLQSLKSISIFGWIMRELKSPHLLLSFKKKTANIYLFSFWHIYFLFLIFLVFLRDTFCLLNTVIDFLFIQCYLSNPWTF